MSTIVFKGLLTEAAPASPWFRNPAFWNGGGWYATAGVGGTADYDGGTVLLDAFVGDPNVDPNASAPDAASIRTLLEFAWADGNDSPQNIVTRLPWLRLRATGSAPSIPVFVY